MDIVITPKRLALILTAAISFFTIAHCAAQFCVFVLGHDFVYGLVPLFDLSQEHNLPTFYSSLTLLLCAVLLAIIAHGNAQRGASSVHHWHGLAVIFVFLSLDETLMLHERLAAPVRTALGVSGPLHMAWIIPYGFAVALVALVYLRFLSRLPPRARRLFLLAGVLYVGGAVGLESVEGVILERMSSNNLLLVFQRTIEELLEMTGVGIFMYALTVYIATEMQELHLHIGHRPVTARLSFRTARPSPRYTIAGL